MNEWSNFFMATAGASATLTGLLFVGVSINLAKILSLPSLPERALISIILLITILVISILSLVPGQSFIALGVRVLVIGTIVWIVMITIDIKNRQTIEQRYGHHFVFSIIMDQVAVLAYIASGVAILTLHQKGVYWLVPAVLLSFIKAVMDAWVLLVEINR